MKHSYIITLIILIGLFLIISLINQRKINSTINDEIVIAMESVGDTITLFEKFNKPRFIDTVEYNNDIVVMFYHVHQIAPWKKIKRYSFPCEIYIYLDKESYDIISYKIAPFD
ncbi:hypothetical protein SAMN06265379_101960 [Saccharicrinis carchari]|uniref:DUF3139 domain-containing protein n=1 Tax=Saccharicrinis carchari TaxID=1168039 RepID=A0A521BI63_SACCC|nr:hypothetical protein SAMN06265379_101960 [Saccharicrinis carchari]